VRLLCLGLSGRSDDRASDESGLARYSSLFRGGRARERPVANSASGCGP
jgi:hypothetical protein